jgi:septum formation inhibitor-activating ATPase MinD
VISAPATEVPESSFHFMLGDSPAGIERLNGTATLFITIDEILKSEDKSFHPLVNNPC